MTFYQAAKPYSYTITYRQLAAFKAQCPCHEIPDQVTSVTFDFDSNGNLIDLDLSDDNGQGIYDVDGPALLALSQDAQGLAFGIRPPYLTADNV
jgi:hypothetical protein